MCTTAKHFYYPSRMHTCPDNSFREHSSLGILLLSVHYHYLTISGRQKNYSPDTGDENDRPHNPSVVEKARKIRGWESSCESLALDGPWLGLGWSSPSPTARKTPS